MVESAEFHEEHHRDVSGGWFRAAVFGMSDGLVTNVSLILGFAGAHPSHSVVRLAGLAGLIAGAFSMGSGEYLSMRAQREVYEHEIEIERQALMESPDQERQELETMFVERGIDRELALRLSFDLMKDPDLALQTHAREELGIDPSATGSPWSATLWSFASFSLGALIPLFPWVITNHGSDVLASVIAGGVGALVLGGLVGLYTHRGVVRWALLQLLIAALAAGVTYGVGHLVGR